QRRRRRTALREEASVLVTVGMQRDPARRDAERQEPLAQRARRREEERDALGERAHLVEPIVDLRSTPFRVAAETLDAARAAPCCAHEWLCQCRGQQPGDASERATRGVDRGAALSGEPEAARTARWARAGATAVLEIEELAALAEQPVVVERVHDRHAPARE